jgi:hypothetical protein
MGTGPVRVIACLVALGACLAAAGCGSSGSGSTTKPPAMLSRGIKGEDPTKEAQTSLHLSAADCAALAALAEERLGAMLSRHATPHPPLSKCNLEGPGIQVNAYLDTGYAAHQRYLNRIDETVQFNTTHPAGLPQYVPHVGEKAYDNLTASWIPAQGSLLAVRGNRWLTVTIAVEGFAEKRLKGEAEALARAGFKLTATG